MKSRNKISPPSTNSNGTNKYYQNFGGYQNLLKLNTIKRADLEEQFFYSEFNSEEELPAKNEFKNYLSVEEINKEFLDSSYDTSFSESSELSIIEQEIFTIDRLHSSKLNNKDNQSDYPQGSVLSTAINMAHLPTEVASMNEMGDMLDSFDMLPKIGRQDSNSTRSTNFQSHTGVNQVKVTTNQILIVADHLQKKVRKVSNVY